MHRKIGITVIVWLPKLIIAVALLYIGCCFLCSSPGNTDLLLNSLAVTFITEVDEMIFSFLAPKKVKKLIEAIPAFEAEEERPARVQLRRIWMFLKLAMSFAIVAVFMVTSPKCSMDPCGTHEGVSYTCFFA